MSEMGNGWGPQNPGNPYGPGNDPHGYGANPYGAPPGGAGMPYAMVPQGTWAQAGQAPQSYKNLGIMMLVSGIKGALISFILILCLIWVCVGAFWFVTLAGSIMEIVVGAMILGGKPIRSMRTVSILGIVSGVLCGNIIGVALEAVALSQMSKPEIDHYLATAR